LNTTGLRDSQIKTSRHRKVKEDDSEEEEEEEEEVYIRTFSL
jgi:hypothetical protein